MLRQMGECESHALACLTWVGETRRESAAGGGGWGGLCPFCLELRKTQKPNQVFAGQNNFLGTGL